MSQELQTGIYYALVAGGLWGIGPLLLKRGLKYADVSTATLVEQHVSVLLLVGLAIYYGEIGQIDPSSRAFWPFSWLAPLARASARFSTIEALTSSAPPKPPR
jgi:uncharacterized membrane protein